MKPSYSVHNSRMDCAPPLKRWLALLSLVLLVLVPQAHSVLQHGLPLHLPHSVSATASPVLVGQDSQVSDDDSPCTLCSVLGSATQLGTYRAIRPVEQSLKLAPTKDRAFAQQRWSFDQFSRPPPSSSFGVSAAG